jgi:hypothetical protein
MKATLLTSIVAYSKGITHVIMCHGGSQPNVPSCKILLMSPLNKYGYKTKSLDSWVTYLAKFCVLQLTFIHMVQRPFVMHNLKVLLLIVLHAIPNQEQNYLQSLKSQLLTKGNMPHRRILIPSQGHLYLFSSR